jgi:hypothetical protein
LSAEHWMREWLFGCVPLRDARLVDDAVEHDAAVLAPRDLADEMLEYCVGPVEPRARDVDPTVLVQRDPVEHGVGGQCGLPSAEQRPLERLHILILANARSSVHRVDVQRLNVCAGGAAPFGVGAAASRRAAR